MSGKNQYPEQAKWQSANPATTLFPIVNRSGTGGSVPSTLATGAMANTDVVYSQIFEISKMDNIGVEVAWSGTPTGVFQVMVSISGINFNALTFDPVLAQPAGSAGGMVIDLNQIPFKYMMLKYTNSSGSGSLTAYCQFKDLN